MSNKIYLGNRLSDLDIGEPSLPVSKVILNVDSENCYIAGDDTGLTIERDCPWATQAMADSVLAKMHGFIYKPYSGKDALLDPAAELGDAVTVGGHYGVLAQMGRNLDRQASATVGAPGDDEIDDEYPYKSKQRKETDRVLAKAYSRISKTAEEILLEVTGLNDKYTSLSLTIDGVTVKDETGATRIKGSSIETDTLYVKSANIEGELVASSLKGSEVNITDTSGSLIGYFSTVGTSEGPSLSLLGANRLYCMALGGNAVLMGGSGASITCGGSASNPVVMVDGTFYAANYEARISALERTVGLA